jgi:hypothetical protein
VEHAAQRAAAARLRHGAAAAGARGAGAAPGPPPRSASAPGCPRCSSCGSAGGCAACRQRRAGQAPAQSAGAAEPSRGGEAQGCWYGACSRPGGAASAWGQEARRPAPCLQARRPQACCYCREAGLHQALAGHRRAGGARPHGRPGAGGALGWQRRERGLRALHVRGGAGLAVPLVQAAAGRDALQLRRLAGPHQRRLLLRSGAGAARRGWEWGAVGVAAAEGGGGCRAMGRLLRLATAWEPAMGHALFLAAGAACLASCLLRPTPCLPLLWAPRCWWSSAGSWT